MRYPEDNQWDPVTLIRADANFIRPSIEQDIVAERTLCSGHRLFLLERERENVSCDAIHSAGPIVKVQIPIRVRANTFSAVLD